MTTESGLIVSWNYFATLGRSPAAGRWFRPEEDVTPGANLVVVIGEALWERRYGRNPGIVDSDIVIEGRPFRVVGVAPADIPVGLLEVAPELWVPVMTHPVVLADFHVQGEPLFGNRGTHWLRLRGRLARGAGRGSAEAELKALAMVQARAS